jgi:hypothetical protein
VIACLFTVVSGRPQLWWALFDTMFEIRTVRNYAVCSHTRRGAPRRAWGWGVGGGQGTARRAQRQRSARTAQARVLSRSFQVQSSPPKVSLCDHSCVCPVRCRASVILILSTRTFSSSRSVTVCHPRRLLNGLGELGVRRELTKQGGAVPSDLRKRLERRREERLKRRLR